MRKYVAPLIVLIAGCAISYWAFASLRAVEFERAETEFNRRAANIASVLANGVNGYSTAMSTHKNLTSINLRYSAEEDLLTYGDYIRLKRNWDGAKEIFSQMAKDAQGSFPGLSGLGWIVASPFSDLVQIEQAGKFLVSPDYQIRQVNSDGGLSKATERAEHFPVFYIEPSEDNEIALGIDLAASTVSRNALVEARATGNTVSTPPIEWIRSQTGQLGFLVFDAVYKTDTPTTTLQERTGNLFAFSFSVVLIDDMLNSSLRGLKEGGLEFFVFALNDEDAINSNEVQPVFSSNGNLETFVDIRTASLLTGLQWKSNVDVLGRTWSLYCFPDAGFVAHYRTPGPALAFFIGLLVTLFLVLYLTRSAGRTSRIEALVEARTQELIHSNEDLEREMASRIDADKHRRQLESQLIQTQKMDSIGQLAGGVAHDFNNLLQAIMGYGDLAMDKVPPDSSAHQDIEQIMQAGNRAKTLVSQLLAFGRRQVLEISEIDLDAVITDLIKMLQRVIGVLITLDFQSTSDLDTIRADRGQIEQILMNLCANAHDAMDGEGTLTIATQNILIDQEFCKTNVWANPGRFVKLSVTDTGHGISQEVQQLIFEPFFTTKELGKGTGLGLSTVFGIIRQHNGMIQVESQVGSGTTFTIYLPAIKTTVPAPPTSKTTPPPGGTETILLADDDKLVREVANAMLNKSGYKVLCASDGEEAIQVLDQHADSIDLALLDVVMPKLGGNAVREHILKHHPTIPILFSSGYSKDNLHTDFVLDEGTNLIQKPYHRDELLKRIREIFDNHASNHHTD
ncbi:MAG: CHASE domain-containing protein [Candidatus Hydrogenedentota bacterium]